MVGERGRIDGAWSTTGIDTPEIESARLQGQRVHIMHTYPEEHLVFGWASVAIRKQGDTVVDCYGDMIPPEELENAAYNFVLQTGEANFDHSGRVVGRLVESLAVTKQKLKAMGLAEDALPQGLWVGFYIEQDEDWARVTQGNYQMFSIEGVADRWED